MSMRGIEVKTVFDSTNVDELNERLDALEKKRHIGIDGSDINAAITAVQRYEQQLAKADLLERKQLETFAEQAQQIKAIIDQLVVVGRDGGLRRSFEEVSELLASAGGIFKVDSSGTIDELRRVTAEIREEYASLGGGVRRGSFGADQLLEAGYAASRLSEALRTLLEYFPRGSEQFESLSRECDTVERSMHKLFDTARALQEGGFATVFDWQTADATDNDGGDAAEQFEEADEAAQQFNFDLSKIEASLSHITELLTPVASAFISEGSLFKTFAENGTQALDAVIARLKEYSELLVEIKNKTPIIQQTSNAFGNTASMSDVVSMQKYRAALKKAASEITEAYDNIAMTMLANRRKLVGKSAFQQAEAALMRGYESDPNFGYLGVSTYLKYREKLLPSASIGKRISSAKTLAGLASAASELEDYVAIIDKVRAINNEQGWQFEFPKVTLPQLEETGEVTSKVEEEKKAVEEEKKAFEDVNHATEEHVEDMHEATKAEAAKAQQSKELQDELQKEADALEGIEKVDALEGTEEAHKEIGAVDGLAEALEKAGASNDDIKKVTDAFEEQGLELMRVTTQADDLADGLRRVSVVAKNAAGVVTTQNFSVDDEGNISLDDVRTLYDYARAERDVAQAAEESTKSVAKEEARRRSSLALQNAQTKADAIEARSLEERGKYYNDIAQRQSELTAAQRNQARTAALVAQAETALNNARASGAPIEEIIRLERQYQVAANNDRSAIDAVATAINKLTAARQQEGQAARRAAQDATGVAALQTKLLKFYQQNENAIKYNRKLKPAYDQLLDGFTSGRYAKDIDTAKQELNKFILEATQAGVGKDNPFEKLFGSIGQRIRFAVSAFAVQKLTQSLRQVYQNVKDIDSAMTQLQIVTGSTDTQMTEFLGNATKLAKQLGVSVKDVLGSIETFSRLGYELGDASTLARFSTILSNVAGVDVGSATTGLTSIIKGYNMQASDAGHIADVLVQIGQKYAISAGELLEAFERGGAALAASGTSFEKSAAIFAAGNAALQDAATVGTAIKTVSARLRGSKTELMELGEEYENAAEGASKYRQEILNLTGKDIMNGDQFKDTYDIFVEIASVWDDLSDETRARVAEILGGTRQLSVISSIITNIKDAENAYTDALNANGTALEANAIYLDSVEGRLNTMKAQFEEISSKVLSSNTVKNILAIGQDLLGVANSLEDVGALLPVLITGTMALAKFGPMLATLLGNPYILGIAAVATLAFTVIQGIKKQFVETKATFSAVQQNITDIETKLGELNSQYDANMAKLRELNKLHKGDEGYSETLEFEKTQLELQNKALETQIQYQQTLLMLEKRELSSAAESDFANKKSYDGGVFGMEYAGLRLSGSEMFSWARNMLPSMLKDYTDAAEMGDDRQAEIYFDRIVAFYNEIDKVRSDSFESWDYLSETTRQSINEDLKYILDEVAAVVDPLSDARIIANAVGKSDDKNYVDEIHTLLNELPQKEIDEILAYAQTNTASSFYEILMKVRGMWKETKSEIESKPLELISFKDVREYKKQLGSLQQAYEDVVKKGKVNFETLEKIFDDLTDPKTGAAAIDGLDEYITKLKSFENNSEGVRQTLNEMLWSYFQQKIGIENVTEANKDYIKTLLELIGVKNADEVVTEYLAQAEFDAAIAAENERIAIALNTDAFREEGIQLGLTGQELEDYIIKSRIAAGSAIATDGSISNLKALATAANVSSDSITQYTQILSKIANYTDAWNRAYQNAKWFGVGTDEWEMAMGGVSWYANQLTDLANQLKDFKFTTGGGGGASPNSAIFQDQNTSSGSGGSHKTYVDLIKDQFDDIKKTFDDNIAVIKSKMEDLDALYSTRPDFTIFDHRKAEYQKIIEAYVGIQNAASDAMKAVKEHAGWESDHEAVRTVADYAKEFENARKAIEQVYDDMVKDLTDFVDSEHDILDKLQDTYTTLTDAVKEYNKTGYLSVDTLQSLLQLEPKYLSMLQDENGVLSVNAQSLQKVIKAQAEATAAETAYSYAKQILIAIEGEDADALRHLTEITLQETDAIYEQSYAIIAQAEALAQSKGMTASWAESARDYIGKLQDMARIASSTVGKWATTLNDNYISQEDALNTILDLTKELIQKEMDDQIDALEEQKDAYADLIDAKKELIDSTKEENDYQKNVADKLQNIADLQNRINLLSLDGSREALAKKAELEKELATAQNELNTLQTDKAADAQKEVLDKLKDSFDQQVDGEIKTLEDALQSEQQIYDAALDRIHTGWATLYNDLLEYNDKYGSDLTATVIGAIEAAEEAVQKYGSFDLAYAALSNNRTLNGYADGGVASYTGLAMLHGKSGAEMILNNADVAKVYEYIHSTPSIVSDMVKSVASFVKGGSFGGIFANGGTLNNSFVVNISHNGEMSDSEARRYGETVAETALDKLKTAFTKMGINSVSNAILK